MQNKFQEKVAIITGSSRGIGKAIAIELAKQGAFIVLNGRNEERLKETETIIQKIHPNVMTFCCDVSKVDASKQLIQATIERFGKLDILINNVGVSMRGTMAELNPDVFQKVFESNVYGTVNPTIPAIPYLRKTKGNIIFISSLAGIRGLPGLSAYCSSKMALRAIAESIRIEEKKHGIHVGLIQVGITEIEHNKETISADGSLKVLKARDKSKVQTAEYVALETLKNIRKRTFITTLTGIGKLNKFMQARFPMLVEKIILKNLHKFEEKSE
jgi:NAD(P)-dependent dehydrogenase (short-subunit alcohol dehydrogenase family)